MATKQLRGLGDIANLGDLRSIPRTRRSAKPQLPTTAILELNMTRNERDHLAKERLRVVKRKAQLERRLTELDKEMDDLLERAQKKVAEIRGKSGAPAEICVPKKGRGRPRMTLDY